MFIPQKLFQFEEKSLIIVSGRRTADLYQCFNGEIDKIDSVTVETPKYSDKEGFFMRLGKGKFFKAGSALEDQNLEIDRRFIKELKDKVVLVSDEFKEIYLFASDHAKKNLPDALPEKTRDKITLISQGNYLKEHPLKIVEMIDRKKSNQKTKFISEAALKILGKRK